MSKYTVDTVEDGCRHLNDLLSVMSEIQFGLGPTETDKRLDSFLWLAIDISDGIQTKIEEEGEENLNRIRGERT
ncbi:hypothetical protein [uncultured Agrobacterium sp.]|uniref:hypothetical protein n=1 Tax=uncultured Agrobacterium sp. TaxID=157277 RepID=UPI002589C94A|nr:hypothetical protein [uncultured Agrobacterium sp.]